MQFTVEGLKEHKQGDKITYLISSQNLNHLVAGGEVLEVGVAAGGAVPTHLAVGGAAVVHLQLEVGADVAVGVGDVVKEGLVREQQSQITPMSI